jgi:flagellar biosynthetic protein FlhB
MAVLLVAGVAVNAVQVGLLLAPKALAFKFDRLDPIKGFGRFASIRTFAELVKSVLKLVLATWIVYVALDDRWQELVLLSGLPPLGIVKVLAGLVFTIWWRLALVMLVLGLLDYGFQRWQYEKDLIMTQREAREEAKEMDGDPRIKQRIRQIQRQMAMQRMMKQVPEADVVITNPTTYAIALRYDPATMEAPVVVAKGMRLVAQRIRGIAIENDVPIVERPELARALYKAVNIGENVPENLFRAVAEVLAFVYRIDRRAAKARERARVAAPARKAV